MSEYIIKNGHVFDPVQGIKGDKADVAIKDGKIVDKAGSGAKVIDAKGKTVMAGAVEIHAHIAGPKVNMGRIYRPEDKLFTCTPTKGIERMGGGSLDPDNFQDRLRVCQDGIHDRNGSSNATLFLPARARGDPRYSYH